MSPAFATGKRGSPLFVCEDLRRISVDVFGRTVRIRTLRCEGDEANAKYEALTVEAAGTTLAWPTG